MLFRTRELKQKEHNIFLVTKATKIKSYPPLEDVKQWFVFNGVVNKNQNILSNQSLEISNDDLEYFKKDDSFLTLRSINVLENYISNKAFTQEFSLRMIYNHGIKLKYEDNKTIEEDYENDIYKQAATRKQKHIYSLINCPLISKTEYEEIKQQFKDQSNTKQVSHEDILKFEKYNIFHKLNINNFNNEIDNVRQDDKIVDIIPSDDLLPNELNDRIRRDTVEITPIHDMIADEIKYDFYEKMIKSGYIEKFLTLQQVLFNENYGIIKKLNKNDDVNDDDNSKFETHIMIANRNHLIKVLCNKLPLNTPITNKEFNDLINTDDFIGVINNLIEPFYKKLDKVEEQFKGLYGVKSPISKEQNKVLKITINKILKNINFKIHYIDPNHTLRSHDKLIISQTKDKFKLPLTNTNIEINNETTKKQKNDDPKYKIFNTDEEELTEASKRPNFTDDIVKMNTESKGHRYFYTSSLTTKTQKTGKIKININVASFRVCKNEYGTWRTYEVKPNKALSSVLSKRDKDINYKDTLTECINEAVLNVYVPILKRQPLYEDLTKEYAFQDEDEDEDDKL